MGIEVSEVTAGGPCHGKVVPGERLEAIDGHPIADVLDYMHFSIGENPRLTLGDAQGNRRELRIQKPEYEELGLEFSSFLMDRQRSCANRCIFCFIDQLPKGMRETLYFKDDDARLSFLMGNYISMTNLSEHDVQRMICLLYTSAEGVGRGAVLHMQGDVLEQLAVQPVAQLARGDKAALASGKGGVVDRENHLHRGFADFDKGERGDLVGGAHRVADVDAVSYTHLDVYKRQRTRRAILSNTYDRN